MNTLNKFLLSFWVVSLGILVAVMVTMDKDTPILIAEGQMTTPVEGGKEQLAQSSDIKETVEPVTGLEPVKEPEIEPQPEIVKETMRLAMVGDVLLHLRLAQYEDFTSSFAAVAPTMQSYDYLIANQESPPVGNNYALSGFPQFSSPPHILRDLQNAGVDMVTIANNHTVDKGEGGVRTFFENLDEYGMPYVGAYKNAEDKANDRIIEVGSIKIGLLAYTYGTNGLYLPKGSPYIINYIDETKIKADIELLKEEVDVVAVSMHWGPEYAYSESDYQKHYAKVLNEAGAHIVLGTHPHVLQPYKKLVTEQGHETHVFYSLGNFFSTILTIPNTMIGGIASLEITKEGDVITIRQPELYATSVLKDTDGIYRVYPLKDVEQRSVQNLDWVKKIIGDEVTVY
ncbi:CapA family protein [Solibacillus sp. A46]|uniref:CapA family protein n=1 Tax=Solibacillus faecavium TaxID=2762221 RepID=A0ABR8XTN8_9BACL|nr:CapA family protein [Solibacillus faecavium]MBD8035313.1 CapA family protein [Solibacillus faecavium]